MKLFNLFVKSLTFFDNTILSAWLETDKEIEKWFLSVGTFYDIWGTKLTKV